MKKLIVILFVSFFIISNAIASVVPIARINPTFGISTYPLVNTNKKGYLKGLVDSNWYENYQDYYARYFDKKGLIDLGLEVNDENIRAVVNFNIRQTPYTYFERPSYSNIPFVGNSVFAIADMNFPSLAFGEFFTDRFFVSLGRRPIKWGSGNYDGAISNASPFMDNLWASYNTQAKRCTFGYNFVISSFNTEALNKVVESEDKDIKNKKTLIAHQISWSGETYRVSIGELNLVYGEYPNLIDIAPFGLFHNLYQDSKSNVMLSLSAEKVLSLGPVTKTRFYGSFAMDDFDLPGEENNGKPAAIGFGLGAQIHLLDGISTHKDYSYTLSEPTLKFEDGLNISYEYYFCSPYMYNRDPSIGKFTVPLKLYDIKKTMHEVDAFFIGFKYGPNSSIHELSVNYSDKNIYSSFTIGLLTRGDKYNIDSPYGKDAVTSGVVDYAYRFKLFGNKEHTLLLSADVEYTITKAMILTVDLTGAFDFAHNKNAYSATVGLCWDIIEGVSKEK